MNDKEKKYFSMQEMLTKRSFETITNCNCRQDKEGAFVDLLNQEQAELQKAKAIEEMARVIENCTDIIDEDYCDNITCDKCRARRLYNLGYRKLPKDSVVLSRDEYDSYHKLVTELTIKSCQASKETAEKIYLQAKAIVDATKHIVQGRQYLHIDTLKEIVKSCGVEIKE